MLIAHTKALLKRNLTLKRRERLLIEEMISPVIFFFVVVAIPNQITLYPPTSVFPSPFGYSLYPATNQSFPFTPESILLFSQFSSFSIFHANVVERLQVNVSLVGVEDSEAMNSYFIGYQTSSIWGGMVLSGNSSYFGCDKAALLLFLKRQFSLQVVALSPPLHHVMLTNISPLVSFNSNKWWTIKLFSKILELMLHHLQAFAPQPEYLNLNVTDNYSFPIFYTGLSILFDSSMCPRLHGEI